MTNKTEWEGLPKRLRDSVRQLDATPPSLQTMHNIKIVDAAQDAAEYITALEAERDALREALREVEDYLEHERPFDDVEACCSVPSETHLEDAILYRARKKVRQALAISEKSE